MITKRILFISIYVLVAMSLPLLGQTAVLMMSFNDSLYLVDLKTAEYRKINVQHSRSSLAFADATTRAQPSVEVQLAVSPDSIELLIDIANMTDTMYAFAPFECWLYRVTPCRPYFGLPRSSVGFVVPWHLERPSPPTYDCDTSMVPCCVSNTNEPFPLWRNLRRYRPQFVLVRPGQRAVFRWVKSFEENKEYLRGSTCRLDTLTIPVWRVTEGLYRIVKDGIVDQVSQYHLYELETKKLSHDPDLTQSTIKGVSAGCILNYSEQDSSYEILSEAVRLIRLAPGPELKCTISDYPNKR